MEMSLLTPVQFGQAMLTSSPPVGQQQPPLRALTHETKSPRFTSEQQTCQDDVVMGQGMQLSPC